MAVRAVIFDFNGVLVDDESIHFALFRELLSQEHVNITEYDYHERYLGYDDRGCFASALADAGQEANQQRLDNLIERKARRYIEVAAQGLRFFPAAAETITMISDRWPVAICSGALRPEIEHALRLLNRLHQVDIIVSAEDTSRGKPDPQCYQLTLRALQRRRRETKTQPATNEPDLAARNCLVIEDSLAGIMSAKGAGMRAIGVPNTYSADQLRQAGADNIIDSLMTLTPEWIEEHFNDESPSGGA